MNSTKTVCKFAPAEWNNTPTPSAPRRPGGRPQYLSCLSTRYAYVTHATVSLRYFFWLCGDDELKSDPESVSGITSPPKVNRFFRLVGPVVSQSFNEIGRLLLQSSCSQTQRTNDGQTDRTTSKINDDDVMA